MKLPVVFVLLMVFCCLPAALAEREFMDMAGRIVYLPDAIQCVAALDATADEFLQTAMPDVVLLPEYRQVDHIRLNGAQVLFCASPLLAEDIQHAELLSRKYALPVICLSSMPFDAPDVFLLLGGIFEKDPGALIDRSVRILDAEAFHPLKKHILLADILKQLREDTAANGRCAAQLSTINPHLVD